MSLKAFHFFFIVASILLSSYLGGWCVQSYNDSQSTSFLLMGIGSFIAAAGLVTYLAWFLRKSKNISFLTLLVAVGLSFASETANACPVCLGDPNHPMVKSANLGVWFLLIVISGVLVGFAVLFAFWTYRSKKMTPSL